MNKTIGIIGGMGPEATCDLFSKIIHFTQAASDQEHIPVLVDSNTRIPDRTAHILGKGPSPEYELIRTALRLEMLGADILIMPCNTAHHYHASIKRHVRSDFPSMIEETAAEIALQNPDAKKVGLLATEGTYVSGIYRMALERKRIGLVEPPEEHKALLLKWIYGLKAGRRHIPEKELSEVLGFFAKSGVDTLILGCTELPVLFNNADRKAFGSFRLVDATSVLAKTAVRLAGGRIRGTSIPD